MTQTLGATLHKRWATFFKCSSALKKIARRRFSASIKHAQLASEIFACDFFKGTSPISRTLAFTGPTRLPRDLAISAALAFCLTIVSSRSMIGLCHRACLQNDMKPITTHLAATPRFAVLPTTVPRD